MATTLPNNSNLECSICFEQFKTPKILSCGHSFCLECLVSCIYDRKGTIPCPFCKQDVVIPQGGVDKFVTNVFLQTSTDSQKTTVVSTTQPSTSLKLKSNCPNHSKKEVEYYCQTCNLGLCYKCILKDHKDHKILDLECDSTRENVVQEISKSEQLITNKIEDLEETHAALLETSKKLKSFCDEACTTIGEKTEKIIGELKENCETRQQEIRDTFDKNESKLTETRQEVMTQIKNIKTDLDTSHCPTTTEEPSLSLIYSLTKLQDLQKLYENMKTDIPPVTYIEWREGSLKVCDILGSTETKPLYQSREGSGPLSTETKPLYQSNEGSGSISTVTRPLYQSSEVSGSVSTVFQPLFQFSSGPISTVTRPLYQSSEGSGSISTVTRPLYQSSEGSGPISTVTKPLYQSSEGSGSVSTVSSRRPISTVTKRPYQSDERNVFRFNYYYDIGDDDVDYFSADKSPGLVWSCAVRGNSNNKNRSLYIYIKLLPEDNPQVKSCTIRYTVAILHEDEDKNVISKTMTGKFTPGPYSRFGIEIGKRKLKQKSKGFIDDDGVFFVQFEILKVINVKYK